MQVILKQVLSTVRVSVWFVEILQILETSSANNIFIFSLLAVNDCWPLGTSSGMSPLIFNCFWFLLFFLYGGTIGLSSLLLYHSTWSLALHLPIKQRVKDTKSLNKYIFSHCSLNTRVFPLNSNSITPHPDSFCCQISYDSAVETYNLMISIIFTVVQTLLTEIYSRIH